MSKKLTANRAEYVRLRILGAEPLEAYRGAYKNSKANPRTQSNEAYLLEKNPDISLMIAEARREAAERVLVTVEDVVIGLLKEANLTDENSTHGARVSAWKELGNFTGGFDKNKQQIEQKVVTQTQEEWLASLE